MWWYTQHTKYYIRAAAWRRYFACRRFCGEGHCKFMLHRRGTAIARSRERVAVALTTRGNKTYCVCVCVCVWILSTNFPAAAMVTLVCCRCSPTLLRLMSIYTSPLLPPNLRGQHTRCVVCVSVLICHRAQWFMRQHRRHDDNDNDDDERRRRRQRKTYSACVSYRSSWRYDKFVYTSD